MRRIFFLALALVMTVSGCIYYTSSPPPLPGQQNTPPTIVAFTAVPAAINPGASAALAWTVVNATTINIDQGIGSVNPVGGTSVSPASTTTYTLTAGNAYGSVYATAQVVVNGQVSGGLPVVNQFTATPNVVVPGDYSTLHWSVTGASGVFISGIGGVGSEGNNLVAPLVTTTYVLTATNGYGTTTAAVQVATSGSTYGTSGGSGAPVVQVFMARPDIIRYGDTTILRWQVDGASSVYITGIGNVGPSGQQSIRPPATVNYTISASNAYGTTNSNALVTVTESPYPTSPPSTIYNY
jgi:hypothetical protein